MPYSSIAMLLKQHQHCFQQGDAPTGTIYWIQVDGDIYFNPSGEACTWLTVMRSVSKARHGIDGPHGRCAQPHNASLHPPHRALRCRRSCAASPPTPYCAPRVPTTTRPKPNRYSDGNRWNSLRRPPETRHSPTYQWHMKGCGRPASAAP